MTQDEIEARGEFTPRTQGEIDRHLFAAKVGGLVSIGPAAFWELFHAAKAWHGHVQAQRTDADVRAFNRGGLPEVVAERCRHAIHSAGLPPLELPPGVDITDHWLVERVDIEFHDDNRVAAIKAMRGWSCKDTGPLNVDGSRQFASHERTVASLGPQARDTETCAPTAQARDTTPSEEA